LIAGAEREHEDQMRSTLTARAAAGCLALALISGCAAHQRHRSSAFIKPGTPTVTIESPMAKPAGSDLQEYVRKVRTLQSKATTVSSMLPTLESQNTVLAAALLRLAADDSAQSHRSVASAYRAAGITDFAYRHYQNAIRLSPCDSASYEGLAQIWRDWGMLDMAISQANWAVYCRPDSSSAYNTLGTVLEALGQRQGARAAFDRALHFDARAAFALNNLCYVALQDGDGPSAQSACEQALALEPELGAARNNLAMAFALQGDLPRAEAQFVHGAAAGTGQYNVGILRMSTGRYREAGLAFKRATAENPSLGDAARRAAQARALAAQRE